MVADTQAGVAAQSRSWLPALLVVLGILFVVRLVALAANATDLFFDEAQYWSWSVEPSFGYYSKPPLIAWLIRLSTETCGLSEFCVRLPSPILHTLTALVVYAIATRLYDSRVGFWAGLGFATLPGVSLSAGIISTDVPLLLCWAIGLYAFIRMEDTKQWWPALLLGVALGLGLNAKYAMAYFVLCTAVYLAVAPDRRWLARDPRLYVALAIGIALIAPNLIWNAINSFATFSHTADNAKWTGSLFNPGKALEFFGAQFGVFGPILFGALLVITVRSFRNGAETADKLLLSFALPVIAIVTVQAFLSRAHANWAAVSYVSATILVTATMIRELSWRWLKGSTGLHAAILLGLGLATATAGMVRLPGGGDPFARTMGWKALADETAAILADYRQRGQPFGAVMTEDRSVTAELLYYMRQETTPVYAWHDRGPPRDHYELTRPFRAGSPEPVLLVSLKRTPGSVGSQFKTVTPIAEGEVSAGASTNRHVSFYKLEGYTGQ